MCTFSKVSHLCGIERKVHSPAVSCNGVYLVLLVERSAIVDSVVGIAMCDRRFPGVAMVTAFTGVAMVTTGGSESLHWAHRNGATDHGCDQPNHSLRQRRQHAGISHIRPGASHR